MTEGNKIRYSDLAKPHEIILAKCGWLVLVWIVRPCTLGKYEVRSNGKTLLHCDSLIDAMQKYNSLVL